MARLVMAAIIGGVSGLVLAVLADLGVVPTLLSYQLGGVIGLFSFALRGPVEVSAVS